MWSRGLVLGAAVFLICSFLGGSAMADSEFAAGERFLEEVVVENIPISTAISFAPDGKMFIALKEGIVRVVQNGILLPAPFLDISQIVNKATDRGLLGIAVDPRFPQQPYVYLSYVWDPPGFLPDGKDSRVIRVVRYVADGQKGFNVAVGDSEEVILGKNSTGSYIAPPYADGVVTYPEAASCMTGLTMQGVPIPDCIPSDGLSHSAGTLIFGADGALYASFGDGANYDFPSQVAFNAQNLDAMTGRIVRVDPDTGEGLPGNPYYDPANPNSNRSKVWALGFRNPFRMTINPENGQVYAGDVGTSYYEEINAGKGANFGWPCYEGGFSDRAQQEGPATISERQVGFKKAPTTLDFCNSIYAKGQSFVKAPIFNYRHPYDATGKDLGSSVTGVAFYTGSTYPERFRGSLFFADYARLFIRYLTFDSNGIATAHDFAKEVGSNLGAVQLISGPDKNIYAVYLDLRTRTGAVRRFRPLLTTNNPPIAKVSATPLVGTIPLSVNFSSVGTVDPDGQNVSYRWDFGDGASSTEPNPRHVYYMVGTFNVTLTVREATAPYAASQETVTIRVGVTPPVAYIDSPSSMYRYEIGKSVAFSGHASPSNATTMSWSILQRHNLHDHLVTEVSGSSGSFEPTEHCDNCSYELCLSVTGQEGLIDQTCRAVLPRIAAYTFTSRPVGASIVYIDEEKEVLAPYVASPIVGSRQTISAAKVSSGRTFVRWDDGVEAPVRTFVTGATPRTFTALYVNKPPRVRVGLLRSSSAARRVVHLSARSSRDPEGEPLSYSWKFSDGRIIRGQVAARSFRRAGRYGFVLTVRDRLGGLAAYTGTIQVGKTIAIRRTSVRSRGGSVDS